MTHSLLADTAAEEPKWDPPQWYPVSFDSPKNIAGSVFFWLTIAFVIAFVLCLFLVKGEARRKFLKAALIAAIAYACAVGITMLGLSIAEDGTVTMLFVPLIVLIAVLGSGAVALIFRRKKADMIIVACHVAAAVVATLVCMGVYYNQNILSDGYYNSAETGAAVNQIVLYISSVLLLAVVAAMAFLFDKGKKGFDSKSIAYAAVCVAMSFALSYIRIVKMPQGGSVTVASLLPLMVYSYMFGTKKGVAAGLIYGVLQALQDPWIIHPAQFLLDYPVAFACIGVAGMFAHTKKLEKLPQVQFALGALTASVLRFISHLLSGVFAFSAYAIDKGMNTWVYSLLYNSFVFLDIAIAIAAGVLVFSSKTFVKQVRKFSAGKKSAPAEPAAELAAEPSAPAQDALPAADPAGMPAAAGQMQPVQDAPSSEAAPAQPAEKGEK